MSIVLASSETHLNDTTPPNYRTPNRIDGHGHNATSHGHNRDASPTVRPNNVRSKSGYSSIVIYYWNIRTADYFN